jgi:hypothetical protein
MAALHGWPFLHQYIGVEVLEQPYRPGSLTVAGAFCAHALRFLAGFFPWSILALLASFEDARKAIRHRESLSVVTLCWIVVLSTVLCTVPVLRQANQWYVIPLFPFFAVSAARFLLGTDARPTWSQRLHSGACLLAVAAVIGLQVSPNANPFALWNPARPMVLNPTGLSRALLLGVLAVAGAIAGACLSPQRGTAAWRRGLEPAAVLVLSVAALLNVLRPLAMVDYRNGHERMHETIISARGARTGMLVVSMPAKYKNPLTRYYFGDLPGLKTEYVLNAPGEAVAHARGAPGMAFCLLISDLRQVRPRFASHGEMVASTEERRPFGAPTVYLSLLEFDGPGPPGGDAAAAAPSEAR